MRQPRQDTGKKKQAAAPPPAAAATAWAPWHWLAALAVALAAAFLVYDPALDGPFVLDDLYLPFGQPDASKFAFAVWVARRPLLGLTYWLNYRMSGQHPLPYHAVNVLLHVAASAMVFLILRRALQRFGESEKRLSILAALGAGVFLLHPVQTEAVAYVASRSDVLSTLCAYAALAVFLKYRGAGVGWPRAILTLALFAAALAGKEQAAVLPAAFLLVDVVWSEGGVLHAVTRNWRLHVPVAAGGVIGAAWVLNALRRADTVGLGSAAGFTWQQYLFTQCRVIWHYLRLCVLPAGLNADTDFGVSDSLAAHGAVFGLAGIVAVIAAAWIFRKRAPLAACGALLFFALLAPTSSFIPIADAVAERRVYFPFIGLALILVEAARRLRVSQTALMTGGAALLAILALATHSRAGVWGDELRLWQDTVEKSPRKMRPRFQLAHIYYRAQKCGDAASQYAEAARFAKPDSPLLVDWALALDCAGRAGEAVDKLREAVRLDNSYHVHSQLGMVLARQGRGDEALAALTESERLKHDYAPTHVYKGNVYASQGKLAEADAAFRRALEFDPVNEGALAGRRFVAERMGKPVP